MAEKEIVCFQSKKVKICRFFISHNYYIYLKRNVEIFVTNYFLVYFGGQLLQHTFYSVNSKFFIETISETYNKVLSSSIRIADPPLVHFQHKIYELFVFNLVIYINNLY